MWWEEKAKIIRAARQKAGLSCQGLMRRLPRGIVITEADVWRLEDGEHCVQDSYVAAVLTACGLPPDWKPEPPTT
jgi:hypothetical protein